MIPITIPIIISLFLTIIYSGMMILFIRGAIKLGKQYPDENEAEIKNAFQRLNPKSQNEYIPKSKPKPSVSVIVPLRNEEKDAKATLDALLAQDYSGEWEILCVDDRSTDRTAIILKDFAEKNSHLHLIQIPIDSPSVPSPKKRALAAGFAAVSPGA